MGRVVIDLYRLAVIAEVVAGGVFFISSRISNPRAYHAIENPKLGFGIPESAQGKARRLDFLWDLGIDGGSG